MNLRCLLFTSDRETAASICQILADLGVEGEHCAEAVPAVERVTSQPFQIVIIDWDAQPEAGLLLTAARERKASERPLTLAIVSDDASVPQALQAGANSILRKPILVSQVNDTLTTARDLLRAKEESAVSMAQAAAVGASASSSSSSPPTPTYPALESHSSLLALPGILDSENDKGLHRGEFLQTSGSIPGRQFVTDSEVHDSLGSSAEPVNPLKDLEPVAAAVAEAVVEKSAAATRSDEPRGLQWYLNARAAQTPAPPMPAPPPAAPAKPELLGFDQTLSSLSNLPDKHSNNYTNNHSAAVSDDTAWAPTSAAVSSFATLRTNPEREQRAEAKLFAYIAGEDGARPEEEQEKKPRSHFRPGKGMIAAAGALAACAIVATPQAPWHPQIQVLLRRGQQTLHAWLNPQPVTTAQAPESHESFGRAGDEYKMPAAENIPDATTDPAQIRVLPVVDPTAKKPDGGANPDPGATPADPTVSKPPDSAQPAVDSAAAQPAPGSPTQPNLPNQGQSSVLQNSPQAKPTAPQTAPIPNGGAPGEAALAASAAASQPLAIQPGSANPQRRLPSSSANVPSSLKSQIASMRPDAGGDKPPEAAMQSIEPVVVPEAAERALITEQPAIDFPANAAGQQGTVILQVVVGRDGTVQDAKFLQGSLAFARTAIDGVKQWKFKPYSMNGRPVAVQTLMTMTFKGGT